MISHTTDGAAWAAWCESAGCDDVYYDWAHLQLWAREWGQEAVGVRYVEGSATVLLALLRDPLDRLPGGAGLCDVRTAYDFGGPWVSGPDPSAVLGRFQPMWDGMLASWGAVTEFQRLHPLLHPAVPAHARHHADNHVLDLAPGYDAVRAGYYGSWRRDLQKAERGTAVARVIETPSAADVEVFTRLYDATMDRLDAPPWYRFSEALFTGLLGHRDSVLVRVDSPSGAPAAAAISLRSGTARMYHLSASDPSERGLFPNHLLLDTLVRDAIQRGAKWVHLGGGAPSLRRFKSRIASGTVPYRIIQRVVDPAAHAALCTATGTGDGAFPPWLGWAP